MEAHPRRQLGTPGSLVELRDSVDNRQAGARGALGVVVMCFGIAEECHHAVTQVLGDVTTEAGYRFRSRAMVAAYRLAPFFGIELRRDPGRPGQVAKQHRQMAALPGDVGWLDWRCFRKRQAQWWTQRSTAITAELLALRISGATVWTGVLKPRTAVAAELLSRGIVSTALR